MESDSLQWPLLINYVLRGGYLGKAASLGVRQGEEVVRSHLALKGLGLSPFEELLDHLSSNTVDGSLRANLLLLFLLGTLATHSEKVLE